MNEPIAKLTGPIMNKPNKIMCQTSVMIANVSRVTATTTVPTREDDAWVSRCSPLLPEYALNSLLLALAVAIVATDILSSAGLGDLV
jgi:hypothetical protein